MAFFFFLKKNISFFRLKHFFIFSVFFISFINYSQNSLIFLFFPAITITVQKLDTIEIFKKSQFYLKKQILFSKKKIVVFKNFKQKIDFFI